MPTDDMYINSLGMKLVRIEAGKLSLGFEGGHIA